MKRKSARGRLTIGCRLPACPTLLLDILAPRPLHTTGGWIARYIYAFASFVVQPKTCVVRVSDAPPQLTLAVALPGKVLQSLKPGHRVTEIGTHRWRRHVTNSQRGAHHAFRVRRQQHRQVEVSRSWSDWHP